MQKPQKYIAKIKSKKFLNPKILQLDLKLINPETITFEPGQFIVLLIAQSTYRSYTILSELKSKKEITVIASVLHEGLGASFLKNLKINDQIEFVGPSGKFLLNTPLPDNLIFYATGTGAIPFIAYLEKIKNLGYKGEIKFFLGNRHESELFFIDKLNYYRNFMDNFEYKIFLSNPAMDTNQRIVYTPGRISQVVQENIKKDTHYYLCGNPYMIDEIRAMLTKAGIEEKNIFSEKFISPVE